MVIAARNFILFGRRTSMRFTPEEMTALNTICKVENIDRERFCEQSIIKYAAADNSASAKVRTAILLYFYESWRQRHTEPAADGQLGNFHQNPMPSKGSR